MSDSTPLRASVVRIVDTRLERIGMGYLIAPDTVITCAHMVADALDDCDKSQADAPCGIVHLNRPLSSLKGDKSVYRQAQVHTDGWYPACAPGDEPENGLADIAILRIIDQPYATPPALAPLAPGPQFDHLTFETYGCPKGHEENGVYTRGLTRAPIGNGRIQVEGESGYAIEPGYSGAPVWCSQVRAVIGVIVQDEEDPQVPAGFVIPSTLLLHACPATIREVLYGNLRACRDILMRGIDASVPASADAIKRFLDTYLGRPGRPVPFGGRGGALKALDDWLADSDNPYRLLTAPAGRGKSALLAHWVMTLVYQQRGWDIIFLPISLRFQTSDELTGLRCIIARLEVFFPREGLKHAQQLAADDYRTMIRDTIVLLNNYPQRRFLLVVDGIDEAMQGWFDSKMLPYELPPNLKVLLSARYKPGHNNGIAWLHELDWTQSPAAAVLMDLPRLDEQGVSDVLACMGRPLDRLADQKALIKQLYRLSNEGDPLLVRLYIEQLWIQGDQADCLTVAELQHLQPGFESFLQRWYRDQQRKRREWAPEVWEVLLVLLATALAPLKRDDLHAIAKRVHFTQLDELDEILAQAFSLVIGDGHHQGYALIHPRLNTHFLEQQEYVQQRQRCEQAFLAWSSTVVAELESSVLAPNECPEYVLRTYVAHLKRGEIGLDSYLALVSNGWRRAWFALEGAYTGFLTDLRRVWSRVREATNVSRSTASTRIPLIGDNIRCVLCLSSIANLGANTPPALLALGVEVGELTVPQALNMALQKTDTYDRTQSLIKLAQPLARQLTAQALDVIRTIGDNKLRIDAFCAILPYLPESRKSGVVNEAMEVIRTIGDETTRAAAFFSLMQSTSEKLQESVLQEAVNAAMVITNQDDRVCALIQLVPHLPEKLRAVILQFVIAALPQLRNWHAISDMVSHLPAEIDVELAVEVLAMVRMMDDERARIKALCTVASHLPDGRKEEIVNEALALAQMMDDERARIEALCTVAPHLPDGRKEEIVNEALAQMMSNEVSLAYMPGVLLPLLPEERRLEALRASLAQAQVPENDASRYTFLRDVVPHLSGGLPTQLADEILAVLWLEVRLEYQRNIDLRGLIMQLPEERRLSAVRETFAITQRIGDEAQRAEALRLMAPLLPDERKEEAFNETLAVARTIGNAASRVRTLSRLVPHLPESLRAEVVGEALVAVQGIDSVRDRANALRALAPYLSEGVLARFACEALEEARAINDELGRPGALLSIVPLLQEPLSVEVWRETVATVRAIDSENIRGIGLCWTVMPNMPEELQRSVLEAAQTIEETFMRSLILCSLASYAVDSVKEEVVREMLAIVQHIDHKEKHAEVLRKVALLMPEGRKDTALNEALAAARALHDGKARVCALSSLVPFLAEHLQMEVVREALAAAQVIDDVSDRADALGALAPHLPDDLTFEAVQAVFECYPALERAKLFDDFDVWIPIICSVGGIEAAIKTFESVRDVGRWWP